MTLSDKTAYYLLGGANWSFCQLFHVQAGNVKMRAAGALAASCAAGMFITSTYVTAAIPEDELRYIFAMLLAVSSSQMVMI